MIKYRYLNALRISLSQLISLSAALEPFCLLHFPLSFGLSILLLGSQEPKQTSALAAEKDTEYPGAQTFLCPQFAEIISFTSVFSHPTSSPSVNLVI